MMMGVSNKSGFLFLLVKRWQNRGGFEVRKARGFVTCAQIKRGLRSVNLQVRGRGSDRKTTKCPAKKDTRL